MVMEWPLEINPHSGKVTEEELQLILILESRKRNKGVDGKNKSSLRVFGMRFKYMPQGSTRGWAT